MRSRSSGTWPRPAVRPRPASPSGRPLIRIAPAGGLADAGQRLEQLRLAVAGDAGDADDLAGADREADALDPGDAGAVAHHQIARPRAPARPAGRRLFSTRSSTLRPTISSASSSVEVAAVRRCATIAPWRMTETLSVAAMISRSLWVISTTVRPWSRRLRRMRNRWSASCGVSTPVGSSRIRMRAPRNSAFRISTRCCTPTGRSATRGVEVDVEAVLALERGDLGARPRRAGRPASAPPSAPSSRFSSTVNGSTSMKC